MRGKTIEEANKAWKGHRKVFCPHCEGGVREGDFAVYFGEVYHVSCAREQEREDDISDREARRLDCQED